MDDEIISSVEQAKDYFFRWKCNINEMSRDGGTIARSYREFATVELERQWKQEYFEQILSELRSSTKPDTIRLSYLEAVRLLKGKIKSNDDILKLLELTKILEKVISDSNYTKFHLADSILKGIIPTARELNLLVEAKEFLRLAGVFLAEDDGKIRYDNELYADYHQCADSLKEISNIEQAKEYFIRFDCDHRKMKYDFKDIASSYLSFATDALESIWKQEAFERKIKSIINGDNHAADYSFFSSTVLLFVSVIHSEFNIKMLLQVLKNPKESIKVYSYVNYASAILEHIIPIVYELRFTKEAQDFIDIAKKLLDNTPFLNRDWHYKAAVTKCQKWIDKLTALE